MAIFKKKLATGQVGRVPPRMTMMIEPGTEIWLPKVETERFTSIFSHPKDKANYLVMLAVSNELARAMSQSGESDFTKKDASGPLTEELIDLVLPSVDIGPDKLFPMMNRMSYLGTITAGIETMEYGVAHQMYEQHFVDAMDYIADGYSTMHSGYNALGRYCAASHYFQLKAMMIYGAEVNLGLERTILSRAMEARDALVARISETEQ